MCFFLLNINPEFLIFLTPMQFRYTHGTSGNFFLILFTFQVESTGTGSLHKIEEESPQEKEAREKFEAGQALLNSSRGDKIQVNTVQQAVFSVVDPDPGRMDPH